MKPIQRGIGITKSEQVLADIADRAFLDLWSYPNVFNDRGISQGQGKEICDLLVVCGRDIIIFSDKDIRWPDADSIELSWKRWFKRAIGHSVQQLRGAERWIRAYPDRIYIDSACTQKLPIDIESIENARIHCIAIATGSRLACSRYFDDQDGGLVIASHVKGDQHLIINSTRQPFMIGDVEPNGSFIHVFDDQGFRSVTTEFDTITDFVQYLTIRAQCIRQGTIGVSTSEEEIICAYLTGSIDYAVPNYLQNNLLLRQRQHPLMLGPGAYAQLKESDRYNARMIAKQESIVWDRLIGMFTSNVIAGTSVEVAGVPPDTTIAEKAIRAMALESRASRRVLGPAFIDTLTTAELEDNDRFARLILPFDGCADPQCGYIFLVMAFHQDWLIKEGYGYYREGRAGFLKAYCQVALYQNRSLKRMVGIAIDASFRAGGHKGGSEDLMVIEIDEWTPELEQDTESIQREANILMNARARFGRFTTIDAAEREELPEKSPNRKGRRLLKSKARGHRRRSR